MGSLIFRPPTESEARPQPDKVGPIRFAVSRRPQAEERVMLHGALPEVLAGSGAVQPEDERVLLLPALVVILHHHQCQFALMDSVY